MNHMRIAAEIAEFIAEQGGGIEEIIRHLSNAADEIEFGWTGARYPSVLAGPVEPSEDERILERVEELVTDRKTLRMDALREALGDE